MVNVLKSAILIGTIALAACGGDSDSEKIKAFKEIVKEGCACKDAECAKAVDKKESSWRMENYQGLSKDEKGSMKNARQEFTKCRDELTK